MSKKRNRNQSLSSVFNRLKTSSSNQPKPIYGASMSKSFFIPKKSLQSSNNHDLTDFFKDRVFNKNISFFRETSDPHDPGMLCFKSSLRQNKTLDHDFTKTTESRPFNVSLKRTMNQSVSKKIFAASAKQSRISPAYYRWHNQSGKSTTNSVEFECSLRDYNMAKNPQQLGFENLVKPIKYQQVEPKLYDQTEIFCPKQRKLFRLKGK